MSEPEILRQQFELGYTYTRSTGPVVGRFLSELRRRKIVGTRGDDGTVYVPPMEYDPITASELDDFVEVASSGEVVSWCWVHEPRQSHPFAHPFAWAMVKLDGADVPMVHAVDAGSESAMHSGMRVQVRWAEPAQGLITDIACFEPETAAAAETTAAQTAGAANEEEISALEAPVYLTYNFTAGAATSRFLHQVKAGRLVGQRCPQCSNVYMPPRGSCAACGVATDEEVQVSDNATVESFTIVWIPIPNNPIQPPYVVANLVADGANISFIHLLSECDNDAVHIGQRVQAVWKPEEEWGFAMDNIRYFKPLDEPDVPIAMIGKVPVSGWEG
ncbi:MAG: OB-fold domain-containing protein [Halieaceae bacterium]